MAARKKPKAKKAATKPLKLFYSPIHGFIHKVLVVAHESGLWNQIEFVPIYPLRDGYSVAAINPLHKVPTLALKDGTVLYGSQAIVEYMDFIGKKKLFPKPGPRRWDALRRMALADTIFEVTVNMALEKAENPIRPNVYTWYWPKVVRALDQMEHDATKLKGFDVGQAATLHALSYLTRQLGKGLMPPVPTKYDWRKGRPKLTAWWNKALERPSVKSHFNRDYKGNDTAAFAQQQIAEVLQAQGKKSSVPTALQKVDFHLD